MNGKFIVIYGINNIGKSTQARMLVEALTRNGVQTEYLKYPVYDLEPTGPRLNRILREGAEDGITESELQQIYSQNRKDFQPHLQALLQQGTWMVAEDYIGTGLAWGWTKGADLATLEEMNRDLLKEDVAILLDGTRYLGGREQRHIHEQSDTLIEECRKKHLALAEKYGWHVVNANQSIQKVHEDILNIVMKL